MSANYGGFIPFPMFASSTVITPLALTSAADTVLFEAYYGFPLVVNGWGAHVCVALTASDPATITLSRRVVGGLEGTEYALGSITIAGGAIAGSVWLCEQIGDVSTEGLINPYLNYGESLVIKCTASSTAGSFLPMISVSPFRSGTTATGTGVAKSVITTNAVGTINHVLV